MTSFLVLDFTPDDMLENLQEYRTADPMTFDQNDKLRRNTVNCAVNVSNPRLAKFGGHHERRHPIVVEYRLQAAVREELGALHQQQVVHLSEETGVVLRVVCDVHQGVQHGVPARILASQVGLLVRILRQVVHDVGLVGARSQ